jgi:hypothetical protein
MKRHPDLILQRLSISDDSLHFPQDQKYYLPDVPGMILQNDEELYIKLIYLLVSKGLDPNTYIFPYPGNLSQKSLLLWAFFLEKDRSESKLFEYLLEKGANPDLSTSKAYEGNNTPMRSFVQKLLHTQDRMDYLAVFRELDFSKREYCARIAALINHYAPEKI